MSDALRAHVERFASRALSLKQPTRALRRALSRELASSDTRAREDALAAASFVALALGRELSGLDEDTRALARTRLRKPEGLEALARATLAELARADDEPALAELASYVLERFERVDLATSPGTLPLFDEALGAEPEAPSLEARPSERAPAFEVADVALVDVVLPFDDVDALARVLDRLASRGIDDVVDEVFAPLFDEMTRAPRAAREAYALAGLLAILSGRLSRRMLPRALAEALPRAVPSDVTRGALGFARSIVDLLEHDTLVFFEVVPASASRHRLGLRLRALSRVLGRDRVVGTDADC